MTDIERLEAKLDAVIAALETNGLLVIGYDQGGAKIITKNIIYVLQEQVSAIAQDIRLDLE